jgi:hypothetical protein
MLPYNNQPAERAVHGNQIPPIGRVKTPYLLAGTPDTGYALHGATGFIGPRKGSLAIDISEGLYIGRAILDPALSLFNSERNT